MKLTFLGVGVWGVGLQDFEQLRRCVQTREAGVGSALFMPPKPAAIPARERRRAGLMINMAVEVAHQACLHAGVDVSGIPSVFVSAMGDTDITDYMCRKLTRPEKLLSPTKFHNSVHNAPSGYWSISAENRAPSTFVGGYQHSFGAGLFEALCQARAGGGPVLLVGYDIANQAPFAGVTPVGENFASALVLAPADYPQPAAFAVGAELELVTGAQRPTRPQTPVLERRFAANPCAQSLALLEFLADPWAQQNSCGEIVVPVGQELALSIRGCAPA